MKVLFVTSGLQRGGAERSLVELAVALAHGGTQVQLVALSGNNEFEADTKAAAIPVTLLGLRGAFDLLKGLRDLKLVIREFNPDALWGWMYHGALLSNLAVLGRKIKPPLFWAIRDRSFNQANHGFATRQVGALLARLSNSYPHQIVFNSQAALLAHVELGFSKARSTVIPTGIDCKQFIPSAKTRLQVRSALNLDSECFLVGHLARFHRVKRHDLLLAAFKNVALAKPQARLVLSGEGVLASNLELVQLIYQAGLDQQVIFATGNFAIPDLLAALDLLVLCSDSESLSRSILEAMACEVPCISTAVGDCELAIGPTGKVVPVGDPAALTAAILELINLGPQARRELGSAARDRVMDHYCADNMVKKYRTLISAKMKQS